MKYTYTTDDGQVWPVTIDNLNYHLGRNQKKYPHNPIHYMHMIINMCKKREKDKKILYTYEEGLVILKSLGIDYEKHVKDSINAVNPMYSIFATRCGNCNHMHAWHFEGNKCCDGKCDCDGFTWSGAMGA